MKEYYVVYDMTPYDESHLDFIQIGLGLQNNDAEMLDRHYNSSSPLFHPSAESEDSSIAMPGYPNVYDASTPSAPVGPAVTNQTTDPTDTTNTTTTTNTTDQNTTKTDDSSNSSAVVTPTTPARHDPGQFMPHEKAAGTGGSGTDTGTPPAPKTSGKVFDIYLASGIAAIIFVIIICFCVRHKKKYAYAHRQLDAGEAHGFAPVSNRDSEAEGSAPMAL